MAAALYELPAIVGTWSDLSQILLRVALGIVVYAAVIVALFPARLRQAARDLFQPQGDKKPALEPASGKL